MSAGQFILVVEDDAGVADVLQKHLEREGYYCQVVISGEKALASIREHAPSLILLDRVLPGMTGDEVVRRLKADPRTRAIPVIMLTGKAEESDELVGLALGADDYIAKPFSTKLLLARIAAQLRRQEVLEQHGEAPATATIMLDRRQPQVYVDKTPVKLTTTEYKILATLIAARGHVLACDQLQSVVYGKQPPPSECSIAGHVEGLRRKMGPAAGYIQAVADEGYAFCGPMGERPPA